MKRRVLFFFLICGLLAVIGCLKEHSLEGANSPSEGSLQDDGAGDCLPKTVGGAYVVGIALAGANNYIDVQVDVTTIGSYVIYTDTVNGMYFRGSGSFTTTGLNTVRIKGNGTPLNVGISNFVVTYGITQCVVSITTVSSLAVFTLDGAPGSCMNATVAGTYTAGTPLNAGNTVTINVTVTTAGAYNIATTVSNGMIFTGSGTLATGAQTIILSGVGSTPATSGPTNIPVTAGGTNCSFTIDVGAAAGPATYTMTCASAVVHGTYTVGTALDPTVHSIDITVDVATAGTYSITGTINGMTFSSAAGATFATAGPGQVVTLTGSGNPTTAGANIVPLTGGTASCNVTVNVNPAAGAAAFTINCAAAVVNGTYTVGTALNPATNTISITVDVTTAGTYSITGTVNGMTFTASGSFASTGTGQAVTLAGSSTSTPTTQGANIVPLTGGTGSCNVTVNVNPGSGGAATFAVNCATATANGSYLINTALVPATNTVTVNVNVAIAGTYTITTTATNGMTFTASGTFAATGVQPVTLNGSGTPTAAGVFSIPVPSGTTPCNFSLTVYMGTWSFTEGANNFSGFIDDAEWDLTTAPPWLILYFSGPTAAGHYFEIDLLDVSATIANNETYNAAVFTGTANTGLLYFEGPAPASPVLYQADPSTLPNSLIFTVTSHNVATKTVIGTFAGNVLDGSPTPVSKTITNGMFKVTYP